jgi:hypothetical protein
MTQPEALRLADELDADSNIIGYDKHAAELRRLYAVNEELRGALDEAMWHVKYKELKAVNESDTALLRQALSTLEGWANYGKWVWPESALEQAKRNTEEAITALRERLGEKT